MRLSPKLLCNSLLLGQKTFTARVPTGNDDLINEFEQDLDLNHSIQELLLNFIFFLDRH
jgi:hypothetical protein